MERKRYNVVLEDDIVGELKEWLAPRKISFSAYLNSLIEADLKEIRSGGKKLRERYPVEHIAQVVSLIMDTIEKRLEKDKRKPKKTPKR